MPDYEVKIWLQTTGKYGTYSANLYTRQAGTWSLWNSYEGKDHPLTGYILGGHVVRKSPTDSYYFKGSPRQNVIADDAVFMMSLFLYSGDFRLGSRGTGEFINPPYSLYTKAFDWEITKKDGKRASADDDFSDDSEFASE
jgi:hypothetical protein